MFQEILPHNIPVSPVPDVNFLTFLDSTPNKGGTQEFTAMVYDPWQNLGLWNEKAPHNPGHGTDLFRPHWPFLCPAIATVSATLAFGLRPAIATGNRV